MYPNIQLCRVSRLNPRTRSVQVRLGLGWGVSVCWQLSRRVGFVGTSLGYPTLWLNPEKWDGEKNSKRDINAWFSLTSGNEKFPEVGLVSCGCLIIYEPAAHRLPLAGSDHWVS